MANKQAKPHGIAFTDADWARIKAAAAYHKMTPSAFVNELVGDWMMGEGVEWGGLGEHGGARQGAGWPKGRKRKPTPSNEGVQE